MTTPNLSDLLLYATTNYGHHTDYFLRHKESGFRTLAAVLTAELAISGFYFSDSLDRGVAVAALLLLGVLSIPLSRLAIISCRQSFRASLEHAFMISKVVSSMGFPERTPDAGGESEGSSIIGELDRTLYVPAYLEHARRAKTTEDFVQQGLSRRGTTFFSTVWTLRIVGAVAVAVGIGGAIAAHLLP